MIKEIKSIDELNHEIYEICRLAINKERVKTYLNQLIASHNEKLFLYKSEKQILGVLGIKVAKNICEITCIAVKEEHQENNIGSNFIEFLKKKFTTITAETDNDAVYFYRKNGFEIKSLGEKYIGVERFLCQYSIQ
ncbi:GNAT family N-acetyltransferase [Macrococcus sp. EM39E]|uniref:GNAT family N-acetyltransferase n=1 Tax=Macrococcus animalis TaxID=3395467 RepID=UPI0039BE062E